MKSTLSLIAGIVVTAAMTGTLVAAQGTPIKKGDEQVTVTGCVQRERDYRKEQDKGKGGIAGTGIGAENEFVLTGVSGNTAYELTGANEKLAAPHINHRVEIAGVLKAAEVAGGAATGGGTAGKPPRGVDVISKDLKLRELEVTTLKMVSASCAAK